MNKDSDQELISYMNEKDIKIFLEDFPKKRGQIEASFNKIAFSMCSLLGKKHEESYFCKYKEAITTFFEEKPNEPIAMFVKYVYSNGVYRKNIRTGNDDFFVRDEKFDQIKDKSNISKIFEFKSLWGKLDTATQKLIKGSMKLMVDYTDTYVKVLNQRNLALTSLKERL